MLQLSDLMLYPFVNVDMSMLVKGRTKDKKKKTPSIAGHVTIWKAMNSAINQINSQCLVH